jgi:hypothetical protein
MNFLIGNSGKRWMHLLLGLALLMIFTVGLAQPAYAAEFRNGDTVVIAEDEVIDDDLFIAGQTVTVNGAVNGDLFAAGADVTVNGPVAGSLFVTGRTLAANGAVSGSVYASGYAFTLGPEASAGRNLYFGGFSLTMAPGSQVGRSVYGGGYQMILNGEVADNVSIGAGALELNGTVGGDVRGDVGNPDNPAPTFFMPPFEGAVPAVSPGLRVGENAQVTGDVDVNVASADAAETPPIYSLANARTRWVVGEFIALLIIGALLLWLWPGWLRRTSAAARRWLPSMGTGLLTVIVAIVAVPIALGLIVLMAIAGGWLTFNQLTVPILGVGLAALVFVVAAFLFVAGLLSKLVVAYLGGRLLLQRSLTASISFLDFVALALGVLIYMVLRALPFGIGWVIGFLVMLLGLGAIVSTLRRMPRPRTATVPATVERRREALA